MDSNLCWDKLRKVDAETDSLQIFCFTPKPSFCSPPSPHISPPSPHYGYRPWRYSQGPRHRGDDLQAVSIHQRFYLFPSLIDSFSARELKRRQKTRDAEARKAEKAAQAPAKPATAKSSAEAEEELNPNVRDLIPTARPSFPHINASNTSKFVQGISSSLRRPSPPTHTLTSSMSLPRSLSTSRTTVLKVGSRPARS